MTLDKQLGIRCEKLKKVKVLIVECLFLLSLVVSFVNKTLF